MMTLLSARFRLFAVASIAVFAACSESTSPPKPTSIAQEQNTVADGTAGTVLTTAPTFVVKDGSGNPLGGVSVTVAVTAGGGTLTDAPTTSKSGPTPIGTWKLGNIAGVNTVTVTVGSLTPLVISVNGKAGPPAALTFVTGTNQTALAGTPVPSTPVAKVADQFGNGVGGIPITFTVIEGDGVLSSGGAVNTDASGNAQSPQWTLGKFATPQTLRATTTNGIGANVVAFIQSSYDVEVRFFGPPMPAAISAMFTNAAARIKASVVGDVPDAGVVSPINLATGCGVDGLPTAFNEVIDDVIIYASVGPIDGVNNVLAFSFPCLIRGPSPERRTGVGIMKFDEADIDNIVARGTATDVIQHEMLHVVGIGTLWNALGLLSGAGTAQTRYTGVLGVGGCITMGGAAVCPASVPLENTGGAGTIDSHWRESVFFNELMTGFVNTRNSVPTGILNPLSSMTITSLADLGYQVNAKAADPYGIPGQSASSILGQLNVGEPQPAWERVELPRLMITRTGKVSPVAKQ